MKFSKKCKFVDFSKETDIFGDTHYFLYVQFKGSIYVIHTDEFIVSKYGYLTAGDFIDVYMIYRQFFLTVDYIKLIKKGERKNGC